MYKKKNRIEKYLFLNIRGLTLHSVPLGEFSICLAGPPINNSDLINLLELKF